MSALDITLSPEETTELKRRVRSATIPQREGRRARIILLAAKGETRDNIARLTGIQDSAGVLSYTYDAQGNLVSQVRSATVSNAVFNETLGYGYDVANNLTQISYPAGFSVIYTRNNASQVSGIKLAINNGTPTTLASGISYQAFGPLKTLTWGNGLTLTRTYDSDYQLNGVAVQHDAAGNQALSNALRSVYDDRGRLITVYQASTQKIADYSYNTLGQRIVKRTFDPTSQALQNTTTYLYGQSGKALGQTLYNAAGVKTSGQYWFWLDGMPLAQLNANFATTGAISSTKLLDLHSDHLNTPRLATDSTQTLLWSWNSDAYGVGSPNEDVDGDGKATSVALRFAGQIYDASSQLSYNYFRDYNTDTGRYVESDPIGLDGGLNTYGYVSGNPLARTDPAGLACNGQGCWNTPQERAYAQANDWKSDYAAASEGGDPYASEASNVANNIGILSWVTIHRLTSLIADHLPSGNTCATDQAVINDKMEAIRKALAAARVAQLDAAKASPTNPVMVSGQSIAKFHNDTFQTIGGGTVSSWDIPIFGGDLPGSNALVNWCSAPACHP